MAAGIAAALLLIAACTSDEPASSPKARVTESAAEDGRSAADKIANGISDSLYSPNGLSKEAVAVPGIVNGKIILDDARRGGSPDVTYEYPVLLIKGEGADLAGAWIGVPVQDTAGAVYLHPVQVNLGTHGDETQTVELDDPDRPVLEGAAVYLTTEAGEDSGNYGQLVAFDPTGEGRFRSVIVNTSRT